MPNSRRRRPARPRRRAPGRRRVGLGERERGPDDRVACGVGDAEPGSSWAASQASMPRGAGPRRPARASARTSSGAAGGRTGSVVSRMVGTVTAVAAAASPAGREARSVGPGATSAEIRGTGRAGVALVAVGEPAGVGRGAPAAASRGRPGGGRPRRPCRSARRRPAATAVTPVDPPARRRPGAAATAGRRPRRRTVVIGVPRPPRPPAGGGRVGSGRAPAARSIGLVASVEIGHREPPGHSPPPRTQCTAAARTGPGSPGEVLGLAQDGGEAAGVAAPSSPPGPAAWRPAPTARRRSATRCT